MEQGAENSSYQENDLTLRELIFSIRDWLKYIFSKWPVILLVSALGGGLGIVYAISKKVKYVAELTFILEDSKSNPLGSYAGLASQFGIDLGGSGGNGLFSNENIIEFLKSRLMIEKTLLSPAESSTSPKSLADRYVEISGYRDRWNKQSALKGIRFPHALSREKYNLKQDSLLQVIVQTMLNNNLSIGKPEKKSNFLLVRCTSTDQLFAKMFCERLVTEATAFYVDTKTQRTKKSVERLEKRVDSIEMLLNQKTYTAAAASDLNLNPARNMARVGTELAARDKVVLQTMYAEGVKNLEMSRIAMAQETPIIQVIDSPILPLKKERLGKLKGLLTGGFLFGLLAVSWFAMKRFFSNLMK